MSNPGPAVTSTEAFVGGGSPQKLGTTTASLVGFYSTAPIAQPSGAAQAAVATDAATTGAATYGFTSAQANGMVATVNAMRAALIALGLIKGS
jgi:hypothetical protein